MDANRQIEAGQRVALIVDRGECREVLAATVLRHAAGKLEVSLAGRPPGAAGRPVAVMVGDGAEQRFVPVLKSVATADSLLLETDRRWRLVFELRSAARYPTFLGCELVGAQTRRPGRCVDLSLTGAAIETVAWDEPAFTLVLDPERTAVSVQCEKVAVESFMGIVVVHARFRALPAETKRAIEALVVSARAEFAEAQEFLVQRADDAQTTATTRS